MYIYTRTRCTLRLWSVKSKDQIRATGGGRSTIDREGSHCATWQRWRKKSEVTQEARAGMGGGEKEKEKKQGQGAYEKKMEEAGERGGEIRKGDTPISDENTGSDRGRHSG